MEFQKLIEERRTIRKYSPESRITKEDLLAVIRAAQEAPSWEKFPDRKILLCNVRRDGGEGQQRMSAGNEPGKSRECLPDRYNLCT